MKTTIFVCFILFAFFSFGQTQVVKLNLKPGTTYEFEYKTANSYFNAAGKKYSHGSSQLDYKFEVEEVDDKRIILIASIENHTSLRKESSVKIYDDLRFPSVKMDVNQSVRRVSSIIMSLLTQLKYKFEINVSNNSMSWVNKAAILEEVYGILKEKGYSTENTNSVIDYINSENEVYKMILHKYNLLLFVNRSKLLSKDEMENEFFKKRFHRNNKTGEFEHVSKETRRKIVENLTVEERFGFISKYSTIKYDSLKRNNFDGRILSIREEKYEFKRSYATGQRNVVLNYNSDNPKDSVITIFYLANPYGTEYSKERILLNKNKACTVHLDLPDQTLIFLYEKDLNKRPRSLDYIFYVEPGDTLNINSGGRDSNSNPIVKGSNWQINKLLNEIQNDERLVVPEAGDFRFSAFAFRAGAPPKVIHNFVERGEKMVPISDKAFHFIRRELIAMEYLNYYAKLKHSNRIRSGTIVINNGIEVVEDFDFQKEEQLVADFDIHDVYNDYGPFSRLLSSVYLDYHLESFPRIQSSSDRSSHFRVNLQDFFFASKFILGGSLFYREMAVQLISKITGSHMVFSPISEGTLEEALVYLDILINQNFDEDYTKSLIDFRTKRLNWEDELFIPQVNFFNIKGDKTKLKSVLKDKPTFIYVTKNWGESRYYFDNLAEENPDIQFIFVNGGDNLNKWLDYVSRAEPVAEQLFLLETDGLLEDVFMHAGKVHIVYDKEGVLLGYDVSEKVGLRIAKESLQPKKKELNKSQLQLIIIVLVSILAALIIGLTIWKWRVRQRFRKEEQKRKLRELELTAIRSQMNPHFLFNALNSVQNLVQQNKGREAHLYLADFAGLIRKVLNNSEKEEVSLAEELEMIQQYLNLEKLRFDFELDIKVDEAIDAHNTLVPSMLLQPFVENAVIHGLQSKNGNRQLKVEISKSDSGILICIEDNGIGREAAKQIAKAKNGKGTRLVQDRLKILQEKQGEKYSLKIIDLEEGTRVEIVIPEES